MFRSCQIIIRELCSLLKLCYSIHNSIRVCKHELNCEYCNITLTRIKAPWWWSSYEAHRATAPRHIPTQHDVLPQYLVCKYELNCEYCNINLTRNKAPWWWSDKIETCRSVLKVFYVKLYVHSLVDEAISQFLCTKNGIELTTKYFPTQSRVFNNNPSSFDDKSISSG